jgi:hypothetical protein
MQHTVFGIAVGGKNVRVKLRNKMYSYLFKYMFIKSIHSEAV